MDLPLRRTVRGVSLAIFALAVAGLIAWGAGQASASHLSCGDTITADATLDSDLVDCPNNGIVIGADDITLDLNGHTIDGDDALVEPCPENETCDVGVANDGHDGVTIKNGVVTDFGPGVFVFKARHNRLRDLAAVENTFPGIVLSRFANSRVERSTASRNGTTTTDSPGLVLFESDDNRITHSTLSDNSDVGLVSLADSDQNHISHNEARGNTLDGIVIEGDRNEIVRNRLVRNGGGILITTVTRGEKAVGNMIVRNEVRNARTSGIGVDNSPKRTLIKGNHVVGSGRSGIIVGSRSTTITKNRAVRNDRFGIQAVKGVIDGGGNRASGNGRARQCVNVKCR
jgi:parallel beta-helix repeat protein